MATRKANRPAMFSEQLLREPNTRDEPDRKKRKTVAEDEDKELITFGYEARIFNDQHTAAKVEQGHYLLPWQSDDTNGKLLMDRFDVRHLLESIPSRALQHGFPKDADSTIDEARYADLDSEEESLFDMSEDERDSRVEAKRKEKQRAQETSNAYRYDYNGNQQQPEQSSLQRQLALQFKTPADMTLPDTQEQADVIAATAAAAAASVNSKLFEIKTQARQGNNPLYAFLSQRHSLYRFYTHIVWLSSSGLGAYGDSSDSDDEEDDRPVQPPADIATVIQKTALSVARSGNELETRIRDGQGSNPKFAFIHPSNRYYPYYQQQLGKFQKNTD